MLCALDVGICSAMPDSSVFCIPASMTACHLPSSPTEEGEEGDSSDFVLIRGGVAILYCILESYTFGACIS